MANEYLNSSTTPVTDSIVNIDCDLWDKAIDDHSSNKQLLYENIKSISTRMLWRLAKSELALSYASVHENDEKSDELYVSEALQHSKLALDLDPNSIHCLQWYCASAGRATCFVSSNERIRLGIEIKKNCDKALALDPENSMLHFIYGRWCYEVTGLSIVERNYAKLFGSSLKSSYSEALDALRKADELKPNWKINYLWIAKVLIAQKEFSDASVKIKEALQLQSLTDEDFVTVKELNKLQSQYIKELRKVLIEDSLED